MYKFKHDRGSLYGGCFKDYSNYFIPFRIPTTGPTQDIFEIRNAYSFRLVLQL